MEETARRKISPTILQQKFGKHVVKKVKDKPWNVVLKKLLDHNAFRIIPGFEI